MNKNRKYLLTSLLYDNYSDYWFHAWFCYQTKIIGNLIFRGKRLSAIKSYHNLRFQIKKLEHQDPFYVLLACCVSLTPNFFLKGIYISGGIKLVPMPLKSGKKLPFAIKWLFIFLKKKYKKIKIEYLTNALLDVLYKRSDIHKKRCEEQKTAIDNRYLLKHFK